MRKILYLLILMLLSFILQAQNDFVRHIITPEGEVTFWRGTQQLWVSAITSPPIYKATYYVAPWGDDDNPGTFEEPWQSWQKGFYGPDPGDTCYFRGGEYAATNNAGLSYTVVYLTTGQGGTIGNPKNMFAYPGETPVLNCYIADRSIRQGVYLNGANYMNIKGLHIKNVMQFLDGSYGSALRITNGNQILVEDCVFYDNEGIGAMALYQTGDTVRFINCDAYNNYDPYSTPAGNQADGFQVYENDSLSVGIFKGCRAWNCSDDGFDTYWHTGLAKFDSCWSFNNGYVAGNGFKMGPLHVEKSDSIRRVIRNCISVNNGYAGYNDNTAYPIKMTLYNNIAYLNGGDGISMYLCGSSSTVRNNVSYGNLGTYQFKTDGGGINDHNSWNGVVTCNDADFVSLDVNQLDNPRQADGSLPVVTYMHLVEGSDLIDAGVDVGIAYEGANPDIGYAESNY